MPIADRPLRSRVKQSAQNPAKTVRISSRQPCLHITSRSRAPSLHRHRRVARDESRRGVPSKEPFFLLTLSPFLLASIWRRPRGESTWHHVTTRDPRVGAFPTFFLSFFLSFLPFFTSAQMFSTQHLSPLYTMEFSPAMTHRYKCRAMKRASTQSKTAHRKL